MNQKHPESFLHHSPSEVLERVLDVPFFIDINENIIQERELNE